MPRRLSAEELMDALALATGVRPGLPRGRRRRRAPSSSPIRTSARMASSTCSGGLARIVMRVRAPQRSQPSAGAEPGQRQHHLGRRRRRQRPGREGHLSGKPDRDDGRGPVSRVLEPAAVAAELESGLKYLQAGGATRRASAGPAVGAGQQQGISCTTTRAGGRIVMLVHSGTPVSHLRRPHAPRTAARRLHRTARIEPRRTSLAWQKSARKAATKVRRRARASAAPNP